MINNPARPMNEEKQYFSMLPSVDMVICKGLSGQMSRSRDCRSAQLRDDIRVLAGLFGHCICRLLIYDGIDISVPGRDGAGSWGQIKKPSRASSVSMKHLKIW